VEFTSAEQDIAVERMLGKRATFSLHPPPSKLPCWACPRPRSNHCAPCMVWSPALSACPTRGTRPAIS
jgi:hypothetical protein